MPCEPNLFFPHHPRVIRYEDFAKDPTSQSQQMLHFLGFQMHPDVRKFLETHTTHDVGGVSSTFRDRHGCQMTIVRL